MAANQYAEFGGNPYSGRTDDASPQSQPFQSSNQAGGAHGGTGEGYGQAHHGESYELTDRNAVAQGGAYGGSREEERSAYVQPLDQRDYLQQVNVIRELLKDFDTDLASIRSVHNRLLDATDTSSDSGLGSQLQNLETNAMSRNDQIRRLIQRLAQDAANTTDNSKSMKQKQVGPLKKEFQGKIVNYQNVEREYRTARQEQIRRQYLIVNPDATDQELAAVADTSQDPGSQGVFQSALSNRRGQAQSALGAVKQRHAELQRIEKTMIELASMFNEVEQLVIAQEPLVDRTEDNAERVQGDIERGNTEIDKGIASAKQRRKLKWFCLFLCILIILGIALGVGLGVGLAKNATN